MEAPSTPFRLRRALIFLAVVWSTGGAFLALQAGFLGVSTHLLSTSVPGSLALPTQTKAASARCREILKGLPGPAQNANAAAAFYQTWQLGYAFGFMEGQNIAGVLKRSAGEPILRRESLPVTTALGIPFPALLEHQRTAYALRDFTQSLEEDPQCVAAALESRHSPRHAALYKFGAALGVAGIFRRLVPEMDDVLTPELRLYGSAAGIPVKLYTRPFSRSAAAPGADAKQAVQSAVDRIDAYLRTAE